MDLSIAIVNWNTQLLLKQCIESIRKTTKEITYEIIVVDNNSKDGSQEMLSSEYKEVILIKNIENLGFNKANNQAIKVSKGDYILILNPDTVMLDSAADKMVRYMAENQQAAALGCKILNGDGTLHPYFRNVPSLGKEIMRLILPERLMLDESKTKANDYEYTHEIEVLSGCCMMVRKTTFERIGLLDERYFMYGDDIDLCYQIKKNKMKIFYMPDASIIHYMKGSSQQCKAEMSIEAYKGMHKLLKKLYGAFPALVYKCCATLTSGLKIICYLPFYVVGVRRGDLNERMKGHLGIIRYCVLG
ncbi:MAG: glycosyltransferase family 2 protein [Candidatus Omnitrophota bacterium]